MTALRLKVLPAAVLCAIALNFALPQTVAQIFGEVGDAGDLPSTAQSVTGVTPLTGISGVLTPNDRDMFRFQAVGGTFIADVISTSGGGDTQLFLFNSSGMGLVANDDRVLGDNRALVFASLVAGNEYFLAISAFNSEPGNSGVSIFPDIPTGLLQPNSGAAISQWLNSGFNAQFSYTINLTGAASLSGSPGPGVPDGGSSLVMISIALLAIVSVRSRLK